jgi:hypothetical protein
MKEGSFEPLVVPVLRRWPAKSGGLGSLHVVIDGELAGRATARDLSLLQSFSERFACRVAIQRGIVIAFTRIFHLMLRPAKYLSELNLEISLLPKFQR